MNNSRRGFTVIEVLVTMTIFIFITSMVVIDYPEFLRKISLKKTAQEVALSLRETKTFAIAVKEWPVGSGNFPHYGMHFDVGNNKQYKIFADLILNSVFDPAIEEVNAFVIQNTPFIEGICIGNESVIKFSNCSDIATVLDIVYERPSPTVTFYKEGSVEVFEQNVSIFISLPNGDSRKIEIWKTGQVSVK